MNTIVKKWAEDNHVSTVNRSWGEQTAAPVSVAALGNLVRAAMLAERNACKAAIRAIDDGEAPEYAGCIEVIADRDAL